MSRPGRRPAARSAATRAAERRPPSVERLRRLGPAVAVGALLAFFLLLKAYLLHPADSDENIYFYMSARTAFGGAWPYRDYFFAHPPLHLLISVLFLKVAALVKGVAGGSLAAARAAMIAPEAWLEGGVALEVVKSIGAVSGAVAGLFVYRAARRAAGPLEAVIAAASLLLATDVLHSFFTGSIEALMFMAIGIERVVAGRDRQAGLAFAAGCLVAMYVAPFGLAVFGVMLLVSRRRALRLALFTAAPLLLVHAACLAWAGRPYWEAVFLYHVRKPRSPGGAFSQGFLLFLRRSTVQVMALPAALAAALLRARGWIAAGQAEGAAAPAGSFRAAAAELLSRARLRADPRRQLLALGVAGVLATLLFILVGRAVFRYYFIMMLVGLALLAGLAYADLLRVAVATARALGRHRSLRREGPALAALSILVALPLCGEALASRPSVRRLIVPDAAVGQAAPRTWRPAPHLGPLNEAVRALLWSDQEVLGDFYPVWMHYLWEAGQEFDIALPFARFARATTPPEATLFGDSTLVPMVALMSGRRVALDEADTNPMRFGSRITPPASFIARLRARPPALILFPAQELLAMGPELSEWILGEFEPSLVSDKNQRLYYILRPRGSGPLPPSPP